LGRNFQEIEKSKHFFSVGVYSKEKDLISVMKKVFEKEEKRLHLYRKSGYILSFNSWLEETRTRSLLGTPEKCISKLQRYICMGVRYFILRFIYIAKSANSVKRFTEHILPNF